MTKQSDDVTRTIPRPIRRQVRQNCGFGCVICGCPIINYDHIEEFSNVGEHEVDNIVLLCPTCHMKKGKLLTKAMIREALESSKTRTRTSPDSIPVQHYTVDVGSNLIKAFRGGCIFQIWDFGHLDIKFEEIPLIEAVIVDANGDNAIEIVNNFYTFSTRTWDIEYVGKTITFRDRLRKVFASLTIDVDTRSLVLRADIDLNNGVRLNITEDGIFADGILLAARNIINNCNSALTVTDNPIKLPHAFSGYIYRNTIIGMSAIAGLNSIGSEANILDHCDLAFVWTNEFLSTLEKNKNN